MSNIKEEIIRFIEEQNEFYEKILEKEPSYRRKVKTKSGKEITIVSPQMALMAIKNKYDFDTALICQLALLNKQGKIPRYHIRDGLTPKVVDVFEEYPHDIYGDLKLLYENGYVFLVSTEKGKLFMTMHCFSDSKEDVDEALKELIKRRTEPVLDFNMFD